VLGKKLVFIEFDLQWDEWRLSGEPGDEVKDYDDVSELVDKEIVDLWHEWQTRGLAQHVD